MKTISKTIIFSTVTLFMVCSVFSTTYAADNYTVLAPLPGTTLSNCSGTGCQTTLQKYLPGVFNLSIGIAAVMAFVMITFGGITYMTSDAISGKSQGREHITNAIWGLLLVIGAWVILYTINPKILEFNLNVQQVPATAGVTGGVVTGVALTSQQLAAESAARAALPREVTAYAGPCANGETTGCVNLAGIQPQVISGLQNVVNACHCLLSITGGTEGGHTAGGSHDTGTGVDLSSSNGSLTQQIIGSQALVACKSYPYAGANFLYEVPGSTCGGKVGSSGTHWHVTF